MFYYVCCPGCNRDLSNYVDEEDPQEITITCPYCQRTLRLQYGTQWDEDFGTDITLFWFEEVS
ncbi:MAG: hypothetical protein GX893_02475 [Firmicutes bacterium]|nr:hypothetical protein [Bacillota bacterium]